MQRLGTLSVGMTAIHELMHVAVKGAGSDEDFAFAAAKLAGADPPSWSGDRPVNYQGSEYWGERLNQACGFASQISNKFTNHKLYR